MPNKPKVVLGFLGPVLDRGESQRRWDHWRPTVSLFQHEELLFDRFEMIQQPKFESLGKVVKEDINAISPETAVTIRTLDFDDPWNFEEVFGKLHDFARNYPFDTDEEEYYIHISTGTHVLQICLFLLTESRHFPAFLIQTSPPQRKESGPPRYTTIDLDLSRYDRIADRFSDETSEALTFLKSGIETKSDSFNELIEQIERVAIQSRAPMLLMGPTGAGKSHLARRIHELKSARHQLNGQFVEVNCATIRGDGAMSSLFGHTKGSFTGAASNRKGHLMAADKGVLFLDEIGELGLDEQAMLLRAIEEKSFFPVGSDSEVKSDFQVIAGTNKDLFVCVAEGTFREDLLARINLWTFELPALKDRKEDIGPNIEYELEKFTEANGNHITFNTEAHQYFLAFAMSPEAIWAGNFRDLNASICRMATLATGKRISHETVREEIVRLRDRWRAQRHQSVDDTSDHLKHLLSPEAIEKIDLFDRHQLELVIRTCHESRNLSDAGRHLFAASREKKSTTNDTDRVRKYLKKFDLDWDAINKR
ncbi:RNA repair transcriptional activator RtcR [Verrucomicrobia bacterium]|nr:RNA repair transcriptional activator RtcR [Verrucomicrobiota bacterium]